MIPPLDLTALARELIDVAPRDGWRDFLGVELPKLLTQSRTAGRAEGLEDIVLWMGARGYATGHGDTISDLLGEMEWQIAEGASRALASSDPAPKDCSICGGDCSAANPPMAYCPVRDVTKGPTE